MLLFVDDTLKILIEKLEDNDYMIVQSVMELLGIITTYEKYFNSVIEQIISVFYKNREILQQKYNIIIK